MGGKPSSTASNPLLESQTFGDNTLISSNDDLSESTDSDNRNKKKKIYSKPNMVVGIKKLTYDDKKKKNKGRR